MNEVLHIYYMGLKRNSQHVCRLQIELMKYSVDRKESTISIFYFIGLIQGQGHGFGSAVNVPLTNIATWTRARVSEW